jgi:predicted MFS family arabinose efflux permease
MLIVMVPVLIVDRLRLGEETVGVVLALGGVAGFVSAAVTGRLESRGREWAMVVWPMVGLAFGVAALLNHDLAVIALAVAVMGLLNGIMDVGIFTIRQRRTDPAWLGRAFAVSISFNMVGIPIGSLMTGLLITSAPDAAILLGAVTCLAGAIAAAFLIPKSEGGNLVAQGRQRA